MSDAAPVGQTLTLLRELPGRFFAVDLYTRLLFPEGSFDLIWSEGAIYNVGFRRGLELWRPLLRPRGCHAVTDAVISFPSRTGRLSLIHISEPTRPY